MKIDLKTNQSLSPWLRKITTRFSFYLLPIIVGIVIVLLLLVVVRPRIADIFKLRETISQSEQKVEVLDTKLATLRSFNQDKLLSDVKKVEIAIPSGKDLPSLLSSLEQLAVESNVTIVAVQTTPGELEPQGGKGQTETLPAKITIAGGFPQLKDFLAKLITAPRVMTGRSLAISSATTKQQATLSATLDVDAYFQSLETTKFRVDEPLQPLTSSEQKILTTITVTPTAPSAPSGFVPSGKQDPFAPF